MDDTPRVTVPVEPTEAMLKAAQDAEISTGWDQAIECWSAMLSAAPAPEGGAVDELAEQLARSIAGLDYPVGLGQAPNEADCHKAATAILMIYGTAPATREEAPVEAGDFGDALLAFFYRHGLKVALDVSEIEALRQSALRAQPPDREDAQPVAWSQDQHDYDALTTIADYLRDKPAHPYSGRQCQEFVQAARDAQFTHPAPDALRELELLEEVCARYADDEDAFLSDDGEPFGSITTECGMKARDARKRFRDRLAALQAEQKGGA